LLKLPTAPHPAIDADALIRHEGVLDQHLDDRRRFVRLARSAERDFCSHFSAV
jgi:hypothetical protein